MGLDPPPSPCGRHKWMAPIAYSWLNKVPIFVSELGLSVKFFSNL